MTGAYWSPNGSGMFHTKKHPSQSHLRNEGTTGAQTVLACSIQSSSDHAVRTVWFPSFAEKPEVTDSFRWLGLFGAGNSRSRHRGGWWGGDAVASRCVVLYVLIWVFWSQLLYRTVSSLVHWYFCLSHGHMPLLSAEPPLTRNLTRSNRVHGPPKHRSGNRCPVSSSQPCARQVKSSWESMQETAELRI